MELYHFLRTLVSGARLPYKWEELGLIKNHRNKQPVPGGKY